MYGPKYLFLEYTGKVDSKNFLYYFHMNKVKKNKKNKKKPKIVEEIIESSTYTKVCDPTIDNTFKNIFREKKTLMCFLNDLLFPSENKIKDIEFTTNDFPGPIGQKFSIGSKRIDLGVKCKFYKEEDKILTQYIRKEEDDTYMDIEFDEDDFKNKIEEEADLVLDIEMQKGSNEEDSERFIKYVNFLDAHVSTKKVWLIALIFQNKSQDKNINKNKSSQINYDKSNIINHRIIKEYKNHIIFEIDIIFYYEMIKKGKKIWILNENDYLTDEGKEWLKLLAIPYWCKSYIKGFYAFPDLTKLKFTQNEVKIALSKLTIINPNYFSYVYDEENVRKEKEHYEKIINQQDLELEKKDQELEKKDQELEKKDQELEKKDQEIKRLKDMLAKKEQSNDDGEEDVEKYYKTDNDFDEEDEEDDKYDDNEDDDNYI